MKTYLPKKSEIVRKWFLIDAKGKTVGKIAVVAANLLRGKTKPDFTPHLDTGDGVIILNAKEVELTGGKWVQKTYYRHSGYPGGLTETSAESVLKKTPEKILFFAISGMLPHTRLKKDMLKRLRICTGTDHQLDAQQPETVTI